MKTQIIQYLVCPECRERIKSIPFKQKGEEVKEGLLLCQGRCKTRYPVTNYIPRLLIRTSAKDKAYQQVKTSFGNKWLSQPRWGITRNTHDFMKKWVLEKYGWHNLKNYKKYLGSKRMILDAGAGLGREVMNFCRYNFIDIMETNKFYFIDGVRRRKTSQTILRLIFFFSIP